MSGIISKDGGPGGERGPAGHRHRGGSNRSVNNNSSHLDQEDSLGTNYTGFTAAWGEFSHEVKQIIKIKHQLCLHHITLHWAGDRVRGTAGGRRVRHHGLGGVGSGLGLGQAERQSGQAESEGP